jgi:hypothetical protein
VPSSDLGHWDADDPEVLRHYSWQDWNPFAARNWFMGDTRGDGEERGSTYIWFPVYLTPYKGVSRYEIQIAPEEKYGRNQSSEVVDGQHENIEDSSAPWRRPGTRLNRVNPAVDAQAGEDFPGLPKDGCRPARS